MEMSTNEWSRMYIDYALALTLHTDGNNLAAPALLKIAHTRVNEIVAAQDAIVDAEWNTTFRKNS